MPLTPREFALLTPAALGGWEEYSQFCHALGVPPSPNGYGLLFCEEDDGRHVTLATADITYWYLLKDAPPWVRAELSIPPEKFRWRRDGWPDEWPERNGPGPTG